MWTTALYSGLSTALVAVLIVVALEKLGGGLGSLVAGSPTTIVPIAYGIASQNISYEELTNVLFSTPVVILVDDVFLYLFQIIPLYVPLHYVAYIRLGVSFSGSFILFMGLLVAYLFVMNALSPSITGMQVLGILSCLLQIVLGVLSLWFGPNVPKPAQNKVSISTYVVRGAISFVIGSITVMLSELNSFLAGIASGFPIIFMLVIFSLWLSQGEDFVRGSIGPLMLGSVSFSVYAMIFCVFTQHMNLILAVLVSYVLSVAGISVPMHYAIIYLKNLKFEHTNAVVIDNIDIESDTNSKAKSDVEESSKVVKEQEMTPFHSVQIDYGSKPSSDTSQL